MSDKLLILLDWLRDGWECYRLGITREELHARRARIARLLQVGIHELFAREYAKYE